MSARPFLFDDGLRVLPGVREGFHDQVELLVLLELVQVLEQARLPVAPSANNVVGSFF